MSFTYDPSTLTGKVRLLIPDTTEKDSNDTSVYAFEDAEIQIFLDLYDSNPFYAAARGLETIALNQARRIKFFEAQGVKVDGTALLKVIEGSVGRLREQGKTFTEQSDSDAVFGWAEMVLDSHSYTERIWNERLRGG